MGKGKWQLAWVIGVNYHDSKWPTGHTVPYHVDVAYVGSALVPVDDPRLIRRATATDIEQAAKTDILLEQIGKESEVYKAAQVAAASDRQTSDPAIATVMRYHAESCHLRPGVYASGGAMDWENQPDKFRRTVGSLSIDLPESGPNANVSGPSLPSVQALGVFLHDACGITAWKQQGSAKWSLRANPSSGALQPLEVHILGMVGEEAPAHWHYNPFWHSLERVVGLPKDGWEALARQLPENAILVAITRIVWRNAWKYGDPGFRYTHHDVGHQLSSLAFAAAAQDACVVLLDGFSDDDLAALVQPDPPEEVVCLVAVFPSTAKLPASSPQWWRTVHLQTLGVGPSLQRCHGAPLEIYYGKSETQVRPLLAAAHEACWRDAPPNPDYWSAGALPPASHPLGPSWQSAGPLRPLIHARRSAVSYDPARAPTSGLAVALFADLLRRVLEQPVWFPWRAAVQPIFFLHRIEGLEPGIYILARSLSIEDTRNKLDPNSTFLWEPASRQGLAEDIPLWLLKRGDVRQEAKLASCAQDIASDSAFAVVFLAEHVPLLEQYGAWWYPRAHWEACALGGALYLAAGAAGVNAGLQATGIGCFFAPWLHALLGVDSTSWADVYHFTVGWPDHDERVDTSLLPYHHVNELRGSNRDSISSRGY